MISVTYFKNETKAMTQEYFDDTPLKDVQSVAHYMCDCFEYKAEIVVNGIWCDCIGCQDYGPLSQVDMETLRLTAEHLYKVGYRPTEEDRELLMQNYGVEEGYSSTEADFLIECLKEIDEGKGVKE